MTMVMLTMAMRRWQNAVITADDHHECDRDRDQPPDAADRMESTSNQATNDTTTEVTAAINTMATAWLFWRKCQLAAASGSILGLCVTCRRHVGNMSRHATQLAILGKDTIFANILVSDAWSHTVDTNYCVMRAIMSPWRRHVRRLWARDVRKTLYGSTPSSQTEDR